MTSFRPGELVLVAFPFTDTDQIKPRPALVALDTGDADFVLARVTTATPAGPHDVALPDWRGAGLLAPSCVRLHKLATIAKARLLRRLGQITPADRTDRKSTRLNSSH